MTALVCIQSIVILLLFFFIVYLIWLLPNEREQSILNQEELESQRHEEDWR